MPETIAAGNLSGMDTDQATKWPYKDEDLVYAAWSRCPCGAGLAYVRHDSATGGCWDCSDILTNRAIASDLPGSKTHTGRLPFIFWEIKSEDQPSARGETTRPPRS